MGYRVAGARGSGGDEWKPRMLQPWIWGTPGMLLKLSVLWFLVGLAVEVWVEARRVGWGWEEERVKVSFLVLILIPGMDSAGFVWMTLCLGLLMSE